MERPLSLRKPATFGLSFGLTLATVTWVLSLLPRPQAGAARLFGLACLVEVVVITVQAWRGLTSHFGVTGTGAGVVAGGAAGGAVLILVTGAAAAVGAWQAPGASPSMRLALRLGFAELLVGLAIGVVMLARGQVLAAGGGPDAAFAFAAALKPAHGVALHGILVLPALAWLLARASAPRACGSRSCAARVSVPSWSSPPRSCSGSCSGRAVAAPTRSCWMARTRGRRAGRGSGADPRRLRPALPAAPARLAARRRAVVRRGDDRRRPARHPLAGRARRPGRRRDGGAARARRRDRGVRGLGQPRPRRPRRRGGEGGALDGAAADLGRARRQHVDPARGRPRDGLPLVGRAARARAALDAGLAAAATRPRRRWIWVHHAPPAGSPLAWDGRRAWGDDVLSGWIARFAPDLVLTGHVHQAPFAPGGGWADRVGSTWVFNAGQQAGPVPAHVTLDLERARPPGPRRGPGRGRAVPAAAQRSG